MIPTANITSAITQIVSNLQDENKALEAEVKKLKSDLGIQKNLTNMACYEAQRAYDEAEKWKKMFYELSDKQDK